MDRFFFFFSVCFFASGIIRFFIPGKDICANLAMIFIGLLLFLFTVILNIKGRTI